MPGSATVNPELQVTTAQAVIVQFPGVAHYRVGYSLLESGLLVKGHGFATSGNDTAILLLNEGADAAEVLQLLTAKVEELVGTGEIRLPA